MSGWKMVPVEPTEEMKNAGDEVSKWTPSALIHAAMLSASPDPTTDEALVERVALAGAKATGCGLNLDSGELVLCNDARLPPDRNAGGCVCREMIVAAIRAIAEAKRHAQFWKDAAPTGGAYLESASQGAARVADGIASMEPLEGQYHPIGYWDWHTGAFHKPDKLTPALQKMIELGRLRTCYVKYDSTEMPPRPVHVGIKPPGQS